MYSYSAGRQGMKTSASEGQLKIHSTCLNVCDCTWDFPAGPIFGPFCLNVVHCQFLELFGRILCSERNEENPSWSKFWLWLHQWKIWILLWLAWLSFGSCPNPGHTPFLCFSHFILMYMISLYSCSFTYIRHTLFRFCGIKPSLTRQAGSRAVSLPTTWCWLRITFRFGVWIFHQASFYAAHKKSTVRYLLWYLLPFIFLLYFTLLICSAYALKYCGKMLLKRKKKTKNNQPIFFGFINLSILCWVTKCYKASKIISSLILSYSSDKHGG